MTFAEQLTEARGDLTARQVAAAVSNHLSVRTVEKWLAAVNKPPLWTHEWIISRVRGEITPRRPKRPQKQKGQNARAMAQGAPEMPEK